MDILVFGRKGQLARSLEALGRVRSDVRFRLVGSEACDIAERVDVDRAADEARPDAIINTAAYTAVDRAESEERRAYEVNAIGAGNVAAAAARLGVPLVHLSTDYVFDGALDRPYRETDLPFPRSAYGRTKLAGEHAVRHLAPKAAVLRTAWVFSPYGGNFVKTMLRLAGEREVVRVVDDQIGNPTYAPEIARACLAAILKLAAEPSAGSGLHHFTGPETMTWCGFARRIMAAAERHGMKSARVEPIATSDYPTPATRPTNSRLDGSSSKAAFALRHAAVDECLDAMLAEPSAPA